MLRSKHPLARATSLKELVDAEWITTSITPRAEKELGVKLFKRYGLSEPKLALRSQSALTLLTCLAHSDLLAMAPTQWTMAPFASRVLTFAIPVKEELKSAPPIILVRRAAVPPSPAAGYLIDLHRSGRRATSSEIERALTIRFLAFSDNVVPP